jgi:hypothetical protein
MIPWMSSGLSNTQAWFALGGLNVVLWTVFVFPMAYRLIWVKLGQKPFWTRMAEQPALGVLLVVVYVGLGPFLFYPGLIALTFLLLTYMLFGLFWVVWKLS